MVWVDLQGLGDAGVVLARLAQLVGVLAARSDEAVARLGAVLSTQPTWVVFDNAEHLAGLCGTIDDLLAVAPLLRVIVTSRVRLRSASARVLVLAGLAVPDEDSRDLEAAQAYDAVRLFQACARAVQPDFELARHLGAVIRCVDAVAGLPLAIELAAGWVRLLPPDVLANELQASVDLLERDPMRPDPPARPQHHSMRQVLEGAWHLLSPAERKAMAELSRFRAGFSARAASAVAGVPITMIASLVDKSLVHVNDNGQFGLHPLVHMHAQSQQHADEAHADAAPRHQLPDQVGRALHDNTTVSLGERIDRLLASGT